MKTSNIIAMAAVLGGLFVVTPKAEATITFTGGVADWTFYYDSVNDTFDVVFQAKGTTVATGLDNAYVGPPGGVGGSTTNYTYDNLQVNVSSAPRRTVNDVDYLITSASGTSYTNDAQPDLGFRTRFRELNDGEPQVAVDQFANFRMTLNTASSTLAGDFIMFKYDAIADTNVILFETAKGDSSHDWSAWGHSHWHYGFSQEGDYNLVFDIEGLDAGGNVVTSTGSTSIGFNIIPEPSSALLSVLAVGALALRRRRA
jgi:hypothetical protein